MNDLAGPIAFDLITPSIEAVRENVRHALTLGLPEVVPCAGIAHPRLTVIGNGPSARQAPLSPSMPVAALNGVLREFVRFGAAPEYWIACDPGEIVADFLDDAPLGTTYLVASKCHPKVFERLAGRNVLMWHRYDGAPVADLLGERRMITGGCSVTLTALDLLSDAFGTMQFDIHGWDCSFGPDGAAHATDQPAVGEEVVTVRLQDGTEFKTLNCWGAEAQNAVDLLADRDYRVRVHGPGMVGQLLRSRGLAHAA